MRARVCGVRYGNSTCRLSGIQRNWSIGTRSRQERNGCRARRKETAAARIPAAVPHQHPESERLAVRRELQRAVVIAHAGDGRRLEFSRRRARRRRNPEPQAQRGRVHGFEAQESHALAVRRDGGAVHIGQNLRAAPPAAPTDQSDGVGRRRDIERCGAIRRPERILAGDRRAGNLHGRGGVQGAREDLRHAIYRCRCTQLSCRRATSRAGFKSFLGGERHEAVLLHPDIGRHRQ